MNNQIVTKVCSHCKEEKLIGEFSKRKASKDGLKSQCNSCVKQHNLEHREEKKLYDKQYYIKNKEDMKEQKKQWYIKNKEEILLKQKQYNSEHAEEISLNKKHYYRENEEKIQLNNKQRHLKHKKEDNLRNKQWRSKNLYKMRISRKKWENNRLKTDSAYRSLKEIRSRNRHAFESQGIKKPMRTIELLGCTALEFQAHLINLFKPGMTKENNGKRKWHKHHVISFSSVDLSNPEQLKKVCHYTNIIPMWEDEHKEWHRKHPQ